MTALKAPPGDFFSQLCLSPLTADSRACVTRLAAPVLRQRISMMSFGTQGQWSQYLSWNLRDGLRMKCILKKATGHETEECVLGYCALDTETYIAYIKVMLLGNAFELGKQPLYLRMSLEVDDTSRELVWRLQGLELSLPVSITLVTLDAMQEQAKRALQVSPINGENDVETQEDVDEYWGQYDKSSESEEEIVVPAHDREEDKTDHYDRYAWEVHTAIESPYIDVDPQLQQAIVSRDRDTETAPAREQEYEQRKTASRQINVGDVVKHIETTLYNLRMLGQAAGLNDDDFERVVKNAML